MELAQSVGFQQPMMIKASIEEKAQIKKELAMLDILLEPAHLHNGPRLTECVTRLFSVYPFGVRHDKSLMQVKMDTWATALENEPLYAIQLATHKWIRYGKKEPVLAEFLETVRYCKGFEVDKKRKLSKTFLKDQEEIGDYEDKRGA